MENRPDFIQRRIDQGMLCGVTGDMLRQLRSLESWQRWASESRIGWPTTVQDLSDPRLDSVRSESWMLKPVGRAGGVYIRAIASLERLDHVANLGLDPGSTTSSLTSNLWYLQEYVPGISIGVSYCTGSNGNTQSSEPPKTRIVGIARSILSEELDAPLPWIYRGSLAPYAVSPSVLASLERFATTVAQSTGIRGLWQADFQVDPKGQLWLLEINPRWSASMELHEILQGYSWITEHVRILCNGASKGVPSPGSPAGQQVAKGIVYAPHGMHLSVAQVDRLWRSGWHGTLRELETAEFCLADIPQSDPLGVDFAEGMPIVTVLVTGEKNPDLLEKIRQARSTVLGWFKRI
jgi:predicted ATP-grasp superfamily ATP-dependent carboligase